MDDQAIESGRDDVYVFSRQAIRDLDHLAQDEYAIPSIVLMENAARNLAEVALDLLEQGSPVGAVIVCGPGNNGGDGLALARHLHNAEVGIVVVLAGDRVAGGGDAAINLAIAERMGIPLVRAREGDPPAALQAAIDQLGGGGVLIVDALLGTGLTRPVAGFMGGLIRAINAIDRERSTVLSVDIPSGLCADTGQALGEAVRADVTVSFVGLKAGFCSLTAQAYTGEVVVADIGAPIELTRRLGKRLIESDRPDHEQPRSEPGEPPSGSARREPD